MWFYVLEVGFTRATARRFDQRVNVLLAQGGHFLLDEKDEPCVYIDRGLVRTWYEAIIVLPVSDPVGGDGPAHVDVDDLDDIGVSEE